MIDKLCPEWVRRHIHPGKHHTPPLYFLHIPKTAGSSMRSILAQKFGDRLCPAWMWDDFFRSPELRFARYDAYSGHFGIDLPKFIGIRMRVVTMLRDPVARTVSHFLQVRRTVLHPMYDVVSKQTLRDFVFDPVTVPMILNIQSRYLAQSSLTLDELSGIFTPFWQDRYTLAMAWENASCYMNSSTLKKAAMRTLHSLDFIGLTEHFDDDLHHLATIFGLPDVCLPRSNVSPREEATQPIDPDVEERILHLTSVDAALYAAAQSLRLRSALPAGSTVDAR